jgi:anthranilate 1,2-dioxygenase small subunit
MDVVATPRTLSLEQYHDVVMLLESYGRLLDEDKLEDWIELFDTQAHYEILSRENVEQGLLLALMLCDNKDMIYDRIFSLREANIYNLHYDCHILGLPRAAPLETGEIQVSCAYSLYQSTPEGVSRLFSVGRYSMLLVESDGRLKIRKQVVTVDTSAILTLLATPI